GAQAPPRAHDVRDRRHRARIPPAGVLAADALAGARPDLQPPARHRSLHGHPAVRSGHVPGPPRVRPALGMARTRETPGGPSDPSPRARLGGATRLSGLDIETV